MLEAQAQSLGREDSLKEEMTTYSSITCLGNPMDRGAWWARVHGVAKSQTRLRDSTTTLSPPRSLSFPSHPLQAKTSAGAGAPGRNFTMSSSGSTGVC